jgi:RNA polymerase sigma-70 factor (ECF subfamily)
LSRRFDEEDVVQSVFRTLFRRVSEGLYDVPDGEELWQLLLVIALNKIRKLATFHRAQKRDVGKTQGSDTLEHAGTHGPSTDDTSLQVLQMVVDDVLRELPSTQRDIVQLRIEGYKTDDIAQRTERSSRTVERVLQQFRLKLSSLLDVGTG